MQFTPDEGVRPVMVWIHGGGFFMGSGNGENDLFGPNHLMNNDIVLVTMNYRLGALGEEIYRKIILGNKYFS